jgi:hypothetical protein
MLHQISVFAENKPGKIDRITEILEKEDVNIRAITISDTGDYGIIKLVVDKPQEGCDALKAVFVFQAENASHAEKVLKDEGFVLLKDNELYCL